LGGTKTYTHTQKKNKTKQNKKKQKNKKKKNKKQKTKNKKTKKKKRAGVNGPKIIVSVGRKLTRYWIERGDGGKPSETSLSYRVLSKPSPGPFASVDNGGGS